MRPTRVFGVVAPVCSRAIPARLTIGVVAVVVLGGVTAGPAAARKPAARKPFNGNVCTLDPSAFVAQLANHPCERITTRHSTVGGISETIYGARYGIASQQTLNHHNVVTIELIHVTGPRARAGLFVLREAILKHEGMPVNVGGGGNAFAKDEFTESPATETEPAHMSSRGEASFVRGAYACTISYGSASPEPVANQVMAQSDLAAIMQHTARQLR